MVLGLFVTSFLRAGGRCSRNLSSPETRCEERGSHLCRTHFEVFLWRKIRGDLDHNHRGLSLKGIIDASLVSSTWNTDTRLWKNCSFALNGFLFPYQLLLWLQRHFVCHLLGISPAPSFLTEGNFVFLQCLFEGGEEYFQRSKTFFPHPPSFWNGWQSTSETPTHLRNKVQETASSIFQHSKHLWLNLWGTGLKITSSFCCQFFKALGVLSLSTFLGASTLSLMGKMGEPLLVGPSEARMPKLTQLGPAPPRQSTGSPVIPGQHTEPGPSVWLHGWLSLSLEGKSPSRRKNPFSG